MSENPREHRLFRDLVQSAKYIVEYGDGSSCINGTSDGLALWGRLDGKETSSCDALWTGRDLRFAVSDHRLGLIPCSQLQKRQHERVVADRCPGRRRG